MPFNARHRFILLCAALLLGACAAPPPPRVGMAPGALAPGQSITLIHAPAVRHYFVYAPHLGMAFGAIGTAVARAHMESRGEALRQLMAGQDLMIDVTLTEAFRRELEGAGFRVQVHAIAWRDAKGAAMFDPRELSPSYERVLVIMTGAVGFGSDGFTDPFYPMVRGRAVLYGADRGKPLYEAPFAGGKPPAGETWVRGADAGPGFPDYESLIARPAETAAALRRAAEQAAQAVVRDMRGE
jgi:hypothetical protein